MYEYNMTHTYKIFYQLKSKIQLKKHQYLVHTRRQQLYLPNKINNSECFANSSILIIKHREFVNEI